MKKQEEAAEGQSDDDVTTINIFSQTQGPPRGEQTV
jgi:hypothetical protein